MRLMSTLAAAGLLAGAVAVVGAGLVSATGNQGAGRTPAPSQAAKKITFPPIPSPGFAPGRPVDQTRAVYQFAAEHPEVLKFVPCYCGCESSGHPHNESCFVKRRDSAGNVVEWDTHGYG
jgi:hypothetical protein